MLREGEPLHHWAKRRATANEATVRKDQMTTDLPRRARRKVFISSAIVHKQQIQLRTGLILGQQGFGVDVNLHKWAKNNPPGQQRS
jgi:hypothetical protein